MVTQLVLIRHGSTAWNKEYRYCGFTDIELNNKGKIQARRLRERLKSQGVDRIYTSDRKRAIQTAGIIFEGYDIEKIPDLREMHFGIFEGLTYKEILKRYPEIYKEWIENPFGTVIPSGENLDIFKKRVVRTFNKIIAKHPNQSIAIVCHGGAISIFITHILKTRDFWKYIPDSASLSILEVKDKKFKIRVFNDVRHLYGIKIDPVRFK